MDAFWHLVMGLAVLLHVVGAVAAVALGVVHLLHWARDRRDCAAVQRAKEAAFVAQAQAELAATGWTAREESLYQAEIAATKRGDLLTAARLGEPQEGTHVS